MFVNVYSFPKQWLADLYEVLEAEKDLKCSIANTYERDNSEFIEIVFECDGQADMLMLGVSLGLKVMSNQIINNAMPKLVESVSQMMEEIKTPSEN